MRPTGASGQRRRNSQRTSAAGPSAAALEESRACLCSGTTCVAPPKSPSAPHGCPRLIHSRSMHPRRTRLSVETLVCRSRFHHSFDSDDLPFQAMLRSVSRPYVRCRPEQTLIPLLSSAPVRRKHLPRVVADLYPVSLGVYSLRVCVKELDDQVSQVHGFRQGNPLAGVPRSGRMRRRQRSHIWG